MMPPAPSDLPERRAGMSRRGFAALVWAAAIFATSCTYISSRVFLAAVRPLFGSDEAFQRFRRFWYAGGIVVVKGWHVTEFAVLMFVSHAVLGEVPRLQRHAMAWAAGFCFLFAASDEWHQTFIPRRGGTWTDVAIDSVGILLAATALWLRGRRG